LTRTATTVSATVRIVLDTNVLLSLWVFADSRFALIRAAIESGSWTALTDAACLAEFERVLGYPEFNLEVAAQRGILAEYAGLAHPLTPAAHMTLPQCSDQDDQKFLALAAAGNAQFLITSDKALLKLARHKVLKEKLRISILTPLRFLDFL